MEKNKLLPHVKTTSVLLVAAILAVNEYLITSVSLAIGGKKTVGMMAEEKIKKIFPPKKLNMNLADIVLAHGVPEGYGAELGVSFDNVQASMNAMRVYDQTYGDGRLKLSDEKMKRYVAIGKKIACEFCCGVKTLVFDDGRASCQCGHSIAMRGLLAYLIEKHGNEYSDGQILRELARWKGVYFPAKMVEKTAREVASDSYSPDIAALLDNVDKNKLKETIKNAPAGAPAASAQPLPGQQGGC